jgi:branched-chain amino acid transport system ATP-binding protein
MILQTKGVSKTFGKLAALNNVDMGIQEEEIFGIAGPNGAGKSTLFNVIAGVYRPSAGDIYFDRQKITNLKSHKICQIGLARTFQIPTTFKTLSVYDNIRVGATFGGGDHRRYRMKIESAIEFLELAPFRSSVASDLDLYTTKLVMLGACLATGCKLLMLDEPLAGLSMLEIKEFLAIVRKINQEKRITILMIEHILDSLIEVSDRMLILHNSKVLCTGDPEGVCRNQEVIEVYLGENRDLT